MDAIDVKLLPGSKSDEERIATLKKFWRSLFLGKDPGSTTWEVLDFFDSRVEQCLGSSPPDIDLAEELTAEAMLHITGQKNP
ncbi:hypothetical protein [Gimesia sp.]|uniref:hypothetical protein n=1 Tax=Gimesia sp. TaxID=2024833 RepID=UPI003A9318E1